jgi:PAS domain S-box-containing protein
MPWRMGHAMEQLSFRRRPADAVDGNRAGSAAKPSPVTTVHTNDTSLATLLTAQQAIGGEKIDLDGALTGLAERALELVDASGAAVGLVEGDAVVIRAASGTAAARLGERLTLGDAPLVRCVRSGASVRGEDAATPSWSDQRGGARAAAQSLLAAPITTGNRVIGAFEVFSAAPCAFGEHDIRALAFLAGLVGLAVRLADADAERGVIAAQRGAAVARAEDSEALFRASFESPALGAAILGLDGRVVRANRALCEMLGYEERELVADGPDLLACTQDSGADWVSMRRLLAGELDAFTCEKRMLYRDGRVIWAVQSATLVRDRAGDPAHALLQFRNVSDRKHIEERLRQSQHMETVSHLAGGVVHDFNNLLTAMVGYSDFILRRLGVDHPLRVNVEEIKRAGERATSLTRQLLAYSRGQTGEQKVLNINTALADMEMMLGLLLGGTVDLKISLASELGQVKADLVQLEQVIMNLALNARDAMPLGGTLTIETKNVDLDERSARERAGLGPGRYVLLSVSDTGCGMDEATKARIFEPLFTTKGPGKGTGLGLSTAHVIVHQSGGGIGVQSEVSRGTTFSVYLPLVQASERPSRPEPRTQVGREIFGALGKKS